MSAFSSIAKSRLASLLAALGLALASYLALLKLYALPCLGPGSCQAVLHSQFGAVFRVPVGVLGALLWLAVILVPDRSKRGALLLLMSAGAAMFMVIQFVVLRGFCLYCTLHAVVTWAVLWLHGEKPRWWAAALGLLLAAGGFLATREVAAQRSQTVVASARPSLDAGFAWLGQTSPRSPILVLSVDCPACLDLLEQLTQHRFAGVTHGPALYWKITDVNHALTQALVAAVLAQEAPAPDAFLAVAAMLLASKDAALSRPNDAAMQLDALFPSARAKRPDAARALAAQTQQLSAASLPPTTPLLIGADGKTRAFFKVEELFPASDAAR
jgi:uncharacterized membrane protein